MPDISLGLSIAIPQDHGPKIPSHPEGVQEIADAQQSIYSRTGPSLHREVNGQHAKGGGKAVESEEFPPAGFKPL